MSQREGGRGKGEAGEPGLRTGPALPAPPFPHSAIRMEGIDKSFGAIRANRAASLDVLPGEIHALVGENGAGKSTLMRILGGLMKPDAGHVEVNGRDVTGWSTNDAIAAGVGIRDHA